MGNELCAGNRGRGEGDLEEIHAPPPNMKNPADLTLSDSEVLLEIQSSEMKKYKQRRHLQKLQLSTHLQNADSHFTLEEHTESTEETQRIFLSAGSDSDSASAVAFSQVIVPPLASSPSANSPSPNPENMGPVINVPDSHNRRPPGVNRNLDALSRTESPPTERLALKSHALEKTIDSTYDTNINADVVHSLLDITVLSPTMLDETDVASKTVQVESHYVDSATPEQLLDSKTSNLPSTASQRAKLALIRAKQRAKRIEPQSASKIPEDLETETLSDMRVRLQKKNEDRLNQALGSSDHRTQWDRYSPLQNHVSKSAPSSDKLSVEAIAKKYLDKARMKMMDQTSDLSSGARSAEGLLNKRAASLNAREANLLRQEEEIIKKLLEQQALLKQELQTARDEYKAITEQDGSSFQKMDQEQINLDELEKRIRSETDDIGNEVNTRRASLVSITHLSEEQIDECMKKNNHRMSQLF